MVKIITDSTSDMSKELLERYDVDVIPLHVHLGEAEYRDGVDITQEEIFRWSNESRMTPKTSAPSITDVMEVFRKYPDDEIVSFCISETMSASGNVMRLAAEELGREDRTYVVNSENLSAGIAHLVVRAAIMAKEGKNGAEIAEEMKRLIPKVRSSFVVDTLVFLHRGGRCSGAAALAGSALKLHPEIFVENGVMGPGKKYRGTLKKALLAYLDGQKDALLQADPDRVFIAHSRCDDDIMEMVYDYLEELHYFTEILNADTGAVVASHCGPGTLGVMFLAK